MTLTSRPGCRWKDLLKKGKEEKIPLKDDDAETMDQIAEQLRAAQILRDTAKTTAEKLASAAAMEAAKLAQKNDQKRRFQEKHLFKSTPTASGLETKVARWQDDIRKLETDIRNRDENKEVALGTSKINYMDPRISVAWCKRCEVPIDKVFAKTLRDKFNWAMAVPPDWQFAPAAGATAAGHR
jgi:DNA topoisomerase I